MVNNKSLQNGKALYSSTMGQKSTDTLSPSGQQSQSNGRASRSVKRKLNNTVSSRSSSATSISSSTSSSSCSETGSSSDPNFFSPARKIQKRGRQSANKEKTRQSSSLNAPKSSQNVGNQPIPLTTQRNRKDFRKNLAPRVKTLLEASFAKGETPSKKELKNLLKSTKLSKDDIKYWFKKERCMQNVRDKPVDEKRAIAQKTIERKLARETNIQPAKVKLSFNEASPILEDRFIEDPEITKENLDILQEKTGWGRTDIKNWYYAQRREEKAKNGRTRSKISQEQIQKLEEFFEKNQFLEQTSKELEGIVTFQYANNWFLEKRKKVLKSWRNGTIAELPWQLKKIEELYNISGSIGSEDMKALAKETNISCFQIKRYLSMRRSVGKKTRSTIPKRTPRGAKNDSSLGSWDSSQDKEEDVDVGDEHEEEKERVENEDKEEKEEKVEDEEEEVERGVGDEDEEEEEEGDVEDEDFNYEDRDADSDYEFDPDNVNILETDGEEEFNGEEEADRNGGPEFDFQHDDEDNMDDDKEKFIEAEEEHHDMDADFQLQNDDGNIRRDQNPDFEMKQEVEENLNEMDERLVQELQHDFENGKWELRNDAIRQFHIHPNLDWRFSVCPLPYNKNINYKEWTNQDFIEFGSYFLSESALGVLEAKGIKGTDAKRFVNELPVMFLYLNKEDFEAERSLSFVWEECLEVKYYLNILFSLVNPVDE